MTQRKQPFRPSNDITQKYTSGVVTILSEKNVAEPGLRPVPKLMPEVSLPYEERKLGIRRYYEARQNQIHVERVIRVPRPGNVTITNQNIARTGDGQTYRIDMVQTPDVHPPSLDLTLAQYRQSGKEKLDDRNNSVLGQKDH